MLPELKTGDILLDGRRREWAVHRVRKPRRNLYDEPLYRLGRIVIGHGEWNLTELEEAGLKLKGAS